jgi:DeoR/GlpR family transcriptional regulator of sugar metabolism
MTRASRGRQIVQLLAARGECSVEELSRTLGVSDMTVRRDLQKLADDGQVIRTHGGASAANQVLFEFQFLKRSQENAAAKQQIGAAAALLVRDGQSVLFDSGSTTLAVARQLVSRRKLTVITTSLPIASVLQRAAGIETLLLGGYVRRDSPDLEGPLTEANLDYLRADIAFIGADGIDTAGNVYNSSLSIARMLAKMVASAEKVYVVADHTKLGRRALASFGNIAHWAGLITDAQADETVVRQLRDAGVKVTLAGQAKEVAAHE